MNKALSITILFLSLITSTAFAQTVGVVCVNSKTKVITVEQTKCPTGTTRLSLNNIASTSSVGCYTASATDDGANPSGRVAVSVNCRTGFSVASDSFEVSDQTRANPALMSKTLTFARSSKVPTGVRFELRGNQNLYYAVTAQAVCCP